MLFKKIYTEGLAHISYLIGDENELAVIDPRRDIQIYIDEALKSNKRITHIFETHRNEDIISGSMELAEATGANVYISGYEELGYVYGEKIDEQNEFHIGELKIVPIHTPGHTLGHLSYLLYDKEERPYAVFTGDSLFYGDVGRTDFYGEENLEKMTGMMYDSIYNKLYCLDDHILVYPAHGPGSACGGDIDERDVSTVGYEKLYNESATAKDKAEFIEKNGYMRLKPHYFEHIEEANVKGAEFLKNEILLNSIEISEVDELDRMNIVDIRDKDAYTGKHIPGSISLPAKIMSSYVGWLFECQEEVVLMADGVSEEKLSEVYWTLKRMGYDKVSKVLGTDTIHKMEIDNQLLEGIEYIKPDKYLKVLESEDIYTLDVRKEEELCDTDELGNRINIPVQLLADRISEVPLDKKLYVVCASGVRATLASSILKSAGIKGTVVYGGMKAIDKIREE